MIQPEGEMVGERVSQEPLRLGHAVLFIFGNFYTDANEGGKQHEILLYRIFMLRLDSRSGRRRKMDVFCYPGRIQRGIRRGAMPLIFYGKEKRQ